MKTLDYGKGYKYAHSYEGNFAEQEFFPEQLSGSTLYYPGNNQAESKLRDFLKSRWKNKYGY
jgi:putative ATPase